MRGTKFYVVVTSFPFPRAASPAPMADAMAGAREQQLQGQCTPQDLAAEETDLDICLVDAELLLTTRWRLRCGRPLVETNAVNEGSQSSL